MVGLGASMGERMRSLELAIRLLDATPGIRVERTSRVVESPPAGGVAAKPFLNAAVRVRTTLWPSELAAACREAERRIGRRATRRWADRVIDLDVLWMEGVRVRTPQLTLPHPRLAERGFAVVPLVEVAPGATDPDTGRPYAQLPSAMARFPVVGALPQARRVPRGAAEGVYGRFPPPAVRLEAAGHGALTMKMFLDTANLDEIREGASWGIFDGVTTNPSLIAKEGRDFVATIAEIAEIIDGPVSAETVAVDAPTMIKEGRLLAKVHRNVVVKVPLTIEGIKTCRALADDGIRVNVTLCFQAAQALYAAKAGAAYISPFVGRLDDVSEDGMDLIAKIVQIYANYPNLHTEVLAASIRHPMHIVQSALAGAHVCTAPFKVYKQLFSHPLTDKGNAAFLKDWETVPDRDIIGQVERFLASKA